MRRKNVSPQVIRYCKAPLATLAVDRKSETLFEGSARVGVPIFIVPTLLPSPLMFLGDDYE